MGRRRMLKVHTLVNVIEIPRRPVAENTHLPDEPKSATTDAIQARLCADEQRPVEDAVGRQRLLLDRVLGDQLELLARLDHDADALLAQEVDLAVRRDGR